MADISKLNPNGTEYNLKDEVARTTKAEAIEKTMAQYEALSTAEKNDPTKIYFIPDYSGGNIQSIRVVTTATGSSNAAVAYGDPDESTSTYTTVVFTSVQSTPLNVENLFTIAYPSPWKIKSLIDGLKFTNNATGVTQILNTNDEISWTYLTAIDYTFSSN